MHSKVVCYGRAISFRTQFIIHEDSPKLDIPTRISSPHIHKLLNLVVSVWLSSWHNNDYAIPRREWKVICWRWYVAVPQSCIILRRLFIDLLVLRPQYSVITCSIRTCWWHRQTWSWPCIINGPCFPKLFTPYECILCFIVPLQYARG